MNRMRELRKGNNLTMKQLGVLVGVSESTISFYETGRHEPDISTLKSIADALNTSIDYLIGRSDIRFDSADAEESELIELYESMNAHGKETAMSTMRAMAAYPEMNKSEETMEG